jgi:hypothetical protein
MNSAMRNLALLALGFLSISEDCGVMALLVISLNGEIIFP